MLRPQEDWALLIPPSVALILYGVVGDESVGRLFIAGIIPGIVLAGMMMGYIFLIGVFRPESAPRSREEVSWKMRLDALLQIWPVLLLIIMVLGSIYTGIATPTEAAAVGCVGSLVLAGFRKKLSWKIFRSILRSTISTSTMIMLIFASALLFGYVLTRLQVPQELASFVASLDMPGLDCPAVHLFTVVRDGHVHGCGVCYPHIHPHFCCPLSSRWDIPASGLESLWQLPVRSVRKRLRWD